MLVVSASPNYISQCYFNFKHSRNIYNLLQFVWCLQDMAIDECKNANMQSCRYGPQHVAPIVWKQEDLPIQSDNIRSDLCFHASCISQVMVERGFYMKSLDSTSLKLKVVAMCGNPKLLANATKSYPGQLSEH